MKRSHQHTRRFPGLNVAVPLHEWVDVPCSGVILWDKALHPPRPLPFGTMRRSAYGHRRFASIHWAPRRCGPRRGQRGAGRLARQLLHLRPAWIVFAEPPGFRAFCRQFGVETVREHLPVLLPEPLTAPPTAGVVTAGLVRQLHAVYFLWTPLRPRLHCPCGHQVAGAVGDVGNMREPLRPRLHCPCGHQVAGAVGDVGNMREPLRPRLHCPCGSGAKIGEKAAGAALSPGLRPTRTRQVAPFRAQPAQTQHREKQHANALPQWLRD